VITASERAQVEDFFLIFILLTQVVWAAWKCKNTVAMENAETTACWELVIFYTATTEWLKLQKLVFVHTVIYNIYCLPPRSRITVFFVVICSIFVSGFSKCCCVTCFHYFEFMILSQYLKAACPPYVIIHRISCLPYSISKKRIVGQLWTDFNKNW